MYACIYAPVFIHTWVYGWNHVCIVYEVVYTSLYTTIASTPFGCNRTLQRGMIDQLPTDILDLICHHVSVQDLFHFQILCKATRKHVQQYKCMDNKYEREWILLTKTEDMGVLNKCAILESGRVALQLSNRSCYWKHYATNAETLFIDRLVIYRLGVSVSHILSNLSDSYASLFAGLQCIHLQWLVLQDLHWSDMIANVPHVILTACYIATPFVSRKIQHLEIIECDFACEQTIENIPRVHLIFTNTTYPHLLTLAPCVDLTIAVDQWTEEMDQVVTNVSGALVIHYDSWLQLNLAALKCHTLDVSWPHCFSLLNAQNIHTLSIHSTRWIPHSLYTCCLRNLFLEYVTVSCSSMDLCQSFPHLTDLSLHQSWFVGDVYFFRQLHYLQRLCVRLSVSSQFWIRPNENEPITLLLEDMPESLQVDVLPVEFLVIRNS